MNDSSDSPSEAEENLREFIEVHGEEGLFILYFKRFIYRFVLHELKSPSEDVEGASRILFSKRREEGANPNHEELLDQCEVWARDLVDTLKDDSMFRTIIEDGDVNQLQNEEVETRVEQMMHQRFEEWEEQSDELLQEVEEEL